MRQVADRYASASIFNPMRRLAALRPERSGRLLRYARDQFSRGRGILWTSQLHGIERLLHTSSFALCTPTGSGKTLVANLALLKELLLRDHDDGLRSEEHTSELQSLMRISYAVFCLKKKNKIIHDENKTSN